MTRVSYICGSCGEIWSSVPRWFPWAHWLPCAHPKTALALMLFGGVGLTTLAVWSLT